MLLKVKKHHLSQKPYDFFPFNITSKAHILLLMPSFYWVVSCRWLSLDEHKRQKTSGSLPISLYQWTHSSPKHLSTIRTPAALLLLACKLRWNVLGHYGEPHIYIYFRQRRKRNKHHSGINRSTVDCSYRTLWRIRSFNVVETVYGLSQRH